MPHHGSLLASASDDRQGSEAMRLGGRPENSGFTRSASSVLDPSAFLKLCGVFVRLHLGTDFVRDAVVGWGFVALGVCGGGLISLSLSFQLWEAKFRIEE